jgi:GR25 family glycosyltransferase involved in LPS biosynthesis
MEIPSFLKTKQAVVVLLAIVVCMIAYHVINKSKPSISTIHVINMDKDIKRWVTIKANGDRLGLRLERFPGFNGKELKHTMSHTLGVGRAMIRPNRYDEKGKQLVNLGTAGCFISHRALLTKLSEMNVSDSTGHLILEDDIVLPDDFLQPGGRWDQAKHHIPGDYDIILLGLWHPHGTKITENITKLDSDPSKRINLGAFCYVVRHGALKHKILPWLKYMVDAYDDQLSLKYGEWKCYGIKPNLVELNEDATSTINELNGNKN